MTKSEQKEAALKAALVEQQLVVMDAIANILLITVNVFERIDWDSVKLLDSAKVEQNKEDESAT